MLRIQLHEAQYEIATDPHRFKVICAGRRFGKSTLARLMIYKWAMEKPGLYWIISPTYSQSVQNHWLEMVKELPRDWIVKKYEGKSVTLPNGSIIELKGADNPDTLRGQKLRASVVDEIASMRNWNWLWNEVLRAAHSDYQAPAIFISTPKGYNHFYDLFNMGNKNEEYKSWRFTSYDNPHIPKIEIDKAKNELEEDVFYQEYMADFRKFTGLVYKDFDRTVHVKDMPLDEFKPVYYLRGLDRGFTNPTASSIIAVNKDGEWYMTHELYKRGLTTMSLKEELDNLSQYAQIKEFEYSTMDSASAGDIAELNSLGMDFIGVKKESGESNLSYVRWKIQKFTERLRPNITTGRPRFYIHPRCVEAIREFEAYSWPEKKNELSNESENPEKLNDHHMDELADLNAMYAHFYEEVEKKPWDNKIPGTYIPPSEPDQDENQFGDQNYFDGDFL